MVSQTGFWLSDCDKYEENKHVVFTGNGYSAEWKQEAAKRGLPNLSLSFGNLWQIKQAFLFWLYFLSLFPLASWFMMNVWNNMKLKGAAEVIKWTRRERWAKVWYFGCWILLVSCPDLLARSANQEHNTKGLGDMEFTGKPGHDRAYGCARAVRVAIKSRRVYSSVLSAGRHFLRSWASTQKKRPQQEQRWCSRTTLLLWRLRPGMSSTLWA